MKESANIYLDSAMFRINVNDVSMFDIEKMNGEDRPSFVSWISRSNDPTRRHTSLIVQVVGEYDLSVLADWINKYEII